MASLPRQITFDCADAYTLALFWSQVFERPLHDDDKPGDPMALIQMDHGPGVLFIGVPEGKTVKNRLHLDLSPPRTMAAEVERLAAAGATVQGRVDEGGSFWTVMLDPEGNEFCVLRGPGDDPPKERPS